jgi:hypothetical protein
MKGNLLTLNYDTDQLKNLKNPYKTSKWIYYFKDEGVIY